MRTLRFLLGLTLPGLLLNYTVAQMWAHRSSPVEPGVVPYIAVGLLFGAVAMLAFDVRNPLLAAFHAIVWGFLGLLTLKRFMSTDSLHATPTAFYWMLLVTPSALVAATIAAGLRALLRR